jgi:DNA-binding LacI/PurR family transcriptional regulator
VLEAARQRGIAIPETVELIGYDDVPGAALTAPTLSTVRQPIIDKGRLAAELLVSAINGHAGAERILLRTELVLRGTTRQP